LRSCTIRLFFVFNRFLERFIGWYSGHVAMEEDIREPRPFEFRSPHGINSVEHQSRCWNSITVRHVVHYSNPGRVWHDISSEQTTVAILLEQIGGYCEARLNVNRPTPRFRYDAGHATFVPADMPIWGYSDNIKVTRDLRLHFHDDALPKILGDDLDYAKVTSPVLMLYNERVTKCAKLLAEEFTGRLRENRMYGESLTTALMASLFGSHDVSTRIKNGGLARWQLKRVLEFLEAHLAEDIGLEELAQLAGLSQSQFARAFKASTGLPPYKWRLHNRIKRAQEMLLNSNNSPSEIALNYGFADQSHFTKAFRRVTGTTPANWKQHHKN
jgi:AraC family transcriptional regulator